MIWFFKNLKYLTMNSNIIKHFLDSKVGINITSSKQAYSDIIILETIT